MRNKSLMFAMITNVGYVAYQLISLCYTNYVGASLSESDWLTRLLTPILLAVRQRFLINCT